MGFDASLWNNRLGITFDYYTRKNFDEIGPMVTAGLGGEIIRAANVAEMNSNGVELSLSSVNMRTKGLHMDHQLHLLACYDEDNKAL